jgi:hypothetical protein
VIGFVASVGAQPDAQERSTKAQKKADTSYPEAVEEATRNVPPPGQASMYVLRPSSLVGIAGCFFLEVDHSTWGGLGNGQFSWAPLSPGEHFFKRTVKGEVSLNAEPGKTYYVVLTPGHFATGGVKFITADEGEKMRSNLSLNPDQWLMRQFYADWPSVRIGMTLDEVQHLLHLSEGTSFRRFGQVGMTDEEFTFQSILGYGLTFKNGILTGKHVSKPFGYDSKGCPAPSSAR